MQKYTTSPEALPAIGLRRLLLGICVSLAISPTLQGQSATIEVNTTVVGRAIPRRLFGSNMEWYNNGNQIWDARAGGLRPAISDQARRSGVTLLRFPGGTLADYYHWRDGIGPQSARRTTEHGVDSGSSKHTFGTHELIEFCRRTGAEPMIQVNVVSGTADEARDWVSYANSPTNPERAANGEPSPLGIKLWLYGIEPLFKPVFLFEASSPYLPQNCQVWKASPSLAMAGR